jgi:hypothetical protein
VDGHRSDDQADGRERISNNSHVIVNGDRNLVIAGSVSGRIGGPRESYLAFCDDTFGRSGYGGDEVFIERDDLLAAIDKFLATQVSGFFLLAGKAGLGKTAFATHLAQARGYHLHVIEPSDMPAMVRKHLGARLIRDWGLTGMLDDDALPPSADRESWFANVLAAAAVARDAEQPGLRIVLVIDGVDEMRIGNAGEAVGLPPRLPDGVYVVVTCRSGSAALDHWAHVPSVEIVAGSDANLFDMRRMLEHVIHQSALAGVIARSGHDPQEVVTTLLNRCAGVWIYLRFVLADLTSGRRSLEDLHDLPDNLWAYYAATIRKWERDDAHWPTVGLGVFAALAASRSGMTADMLAEVIGAGEIAARAGEIAGRAEAFLDGPLEAFCHVERTGGVSHYRLYHSSLRYFATGEIDVTKRTHGDFSPPDEALLPLRRRLKKAVVRAHQGVVSYLFQRWGGLEDGLPGLADRTCSDPRDTYGLDQLVWHLEHAQQLDQIHLLMSGRTLHRKPDQLMPALPAVWLGAHQRAGLLDIYAEHVRWCRSHADASIGRPGSFSVAAATLACRYVCLLASLNTIAGTVTPALVAALVRIGVRPINAAITYASRLAAPLERAEALLQLIPISSGPDRDRAVRGALDALLQASDTQHRCMIFLRLASFLPPHLAAEAIPAATRVAVPGQRVGILLRLLKAYPLEAREPAAIKLYHRALGCSEVDRMFDLLIAAVPFLPNELALRAGEYARALGHQYPIGLGAMAVALARRLGEAEFNDVGRDAVLGIRCIWDDDVATQQFAQIACLLPRAGVVELTYGAFRLRSTPQWPTVIGQLAAHAVDSPQEVFDLVRDNPGSQEWQWTVDALARFLGWAEFADLLAVAQTSSPEVQVSALLTLAPHLPSSLRRQLVPRACGGTRMERVVISGIARMDEALSGPDPEIRMAFDDAASIRDQVLAKQAMHELRAKLEEKLEEAQRRWQKDEILYGQCEQKAGSVGCALCVKQDGKTVCAKIANKALVDEAMALEGTDIGRLRSLIARLERSSRPHVWRLIIEEADMLVTQLGVSGIYRVIQDIEEICFLLG